MTNENNSSADARAKRLKMIRHMASFTREEMCKVDYLNVNVYRGWELAHFGGLPEKGATKAIKRLADEGVICSIEWLLNGEGTPPYIKP